MRQPFPSARPGLTLLEVVISLAIFLFSLAALAHLIGNASQRALEARQRQEAALLAQTKINEMSIGALPLSSQSETAGDETSGWLWSAECSEGEVPGLWHVEVRVWRERPDGSSLQVALQQIVLDPALRGSTLDQPPSSDQAQQPESPSGSGSSSSSGNTSSQSTQGGGNQKGSGAQPGGGMR